MSSSFDITHKMVIDHYSSLAREDVSKNADHIKKVAESFGYSPEDLASIPEGANLGVSCGNPLVVAGLKAGETVLDLGSGAGFDVFQAARKVGPTGLSIGVDMSQDMLDRAQKNAAKGSVTNVKFVLAPITKIALDSETIDCVISNCVINLLEPDQKKICFAEVYRLLKPGGRLAVSDVLAKKAFPDHLRHDLGLYVGCVSGASMVSETETWLKEVGFEEIMIVDNKNDLNLYKERGEDGEQTTHCGTSDPVEKGKAAAPICCIPVKEMEISESGEPKQDMKRKIKKIDFNEWVSSYSIYAIKPTKPS